MLKQEVQIILTLEVDADKSKQDIKDFFNDMNRTYTQTVSARNKWEFNKITLIDVKEEAEIYDTENPKEKELILLLGTEIVNALEEGDNKEFKEIIKSGSYAYEVIELPVLNRGKIASILDAVDGWDDWCFIDQKTLDKIKKIEGK